MFMLKQYMKAMLCGIRFLSEVRPVRSLHRLFTFTEKPNTLLLLP